MATEVYVFPTSFGQQRLWFLDQLEPDNPFYNIPLAMRLSGPLNIEAFKQSLDHIVARHEALRTSFTTLDDNPIQVISPSASLELTLIDLSQTSEQEREQQARRVAVEEAKRPFDLSEGPLVRASLVRLGQCEHILLLTMHHIVSDGRSLDVFLQELATLYEAFSTGRASPLPDLPIQYGDFAQWQRDWMQGEVLEKQLAYWKKQLAGGLTVLELPADRPRPSTQSFRGSKQYFALSSRLGDELARLSRREGVTLFMTLLAAFQTLLYRYTGRDDIVVGSPIANRHQTETEGLIGFFVNTLVLRTDLSGSPSFRELLGRVKRVALEAYANQNAPFEKLVEELQPERSLSHSPLFQVAFALDNGSKSAPEFPGLSLSRMEVDIKTSKFDLTLYMFEKAEGLSCLFEYSTDLFDDATITRMIGHFEVLLQGIAAHPEQSLSELPLLTEAELHQLLVVGNNGKTDYPKDQCIHELFEAQVRRSPEAVAVVFGKEQLTYFELNKRANQLSRYLSKCGVGPEVLVGICVERSIEMVVGLLGILKAGGAYVPLDPEYPKERLSFILGDTGTPVLLTQNRLIERLPDHEARLICLDTDWDNIAQESEQNPLSRATAENLAYVIYTSGSTGKPKGVLVTHYNVVRLFEATQSWFNFNERDVWTLFHSYAFDFSVWELWGALLYGGRLVVVPYWVSRSPEAFYDLLSKEQVTVLNQTPSAFRQLIQAEQYLDVARELGLRVVIFGGEALELQSLKPWFDRHGDRHPELINMYGITETTVHVTYRPLTAADLTKSSASVIGGPIRDLQVYVLDRHLQTVPIGVPGEMYVGGGGVGRGYLNRPELTAERFIPNPYIGESGARLYKTGDLVRYLANGDIEFLGRIDNQVKVRGFRIELGEVEAALGQHPAVGDSVVITREDLPGNKRLVAYFVPDQQHAFAIRQLLRFEREGLLAGRLKFELPNGMEIICQNKSETEFLYKEIFEEQSYLRHGITLDEGDTIFDVGANTGLFALFVGQVCKNAIIYAFEPIPPVFEILHINTALYNLNVKLFECGLSNQTGSDTFTYYPHASVLSGRFADADEEREVVKSFLLNQQQFGPNQTVLLREQLDEVVAERLSGERFTCQLKTLSDVICENGVERIDLLKIDVEKSELHVLAGIEESDWQKIRQVIVEVHDIDGRLEQITAMLKSHGYDLIVEQDALLKNTGLYNIYAARPRKQRRLSRDSSGKTNSKPSPTWSSPNQLLSDLRRFLKEKLPEYMVPAALVMLESIPLTPNGKVDRRGLPSPDRFILDREATFVAPRTPVEEALAKIWAGVLGLDKVSIYDNFFELGGDSILSIQIIARANRMGLRLTPRQIFQHQTVAELAGVAGTASFVQAEQNAVTGSVPLTPVQHWFFQQDLPDLHHFNQAKLLEARQALDLSLLERVVRHLLVHHDALRLRFVRERSGWQQFNVGPEETAPLTRVDLSRVAEAEQDATVQAAAARLQTSLSLSEGPLVKVALFDLGTRMPNRLLLVIHHLAVDGVSWRILLEDLQTAYRQLMRGEAIKLPPKTTSFKQWAEGLREYAQSSAPLKEESHWLADERQKISPLPVDYHGGHNTQESASKVTVSLSVEETQALLQEVPAVYGTRINDVLLAAFMQAFAEWSGQSRLVIDLEGHGREEILEGVDLSRTVGWFTTIFPVLLELDARMAAGSALKTIKEQLRRVPNQGIGYGLLRYGSGHEEIARKLRLFAQAEVSFNYLGQFSEAGSEDPLFVTISDPSGPLFSPRQSRSYLLDVIGLVRGGQLQMNWIYSENAHRRATIESLARGFIRSLGSLVAHCQSAEAGGYTPSDFPDVEMDQGRLDKVLAEINTDDWENAYDE